ncbi:MAG: DUF4430 domain-containing protein [Collinsella stercoris]|nr:DUF4430 domain-containing protein [Collinsella stercoris]
MLRSHKAAPCCGVARHVVTAVLLAALTVASVPTAAFAEALGIEGAVAAASQPVASEAAAASDEGMQRPGAESGAPVAGGAAPEGAAQDDAVHVEQGAPEEEAVDGSAGAGATGDAQQEAPGGLADEPEGSDGAGQLAAGATATGRPDSTQAGTDRDDAAEDASAMESADSQEEDAEDAQKLNVTLAVVGPDADGAHAYWAPSTSLEMEDGSTAADASEQLFKRAGLTADYGTGDYGWYLNTITSPYTGDALGWDQATGKYWQLFVNGEASELGAGGVTLKAGDVVTWAYSAFGDGIPTVGAFEVSVSVVGPDANGNNVTWASNTRLTVENGTAAAAASELLFKEAGLKADYGTGSYGWYLNTITSPYTGDALGWDQATGKYWQLFVNGTASELGAGSVMLKAGDAVTWAYSAFEEDLPEPLPVVPDPDAPRPEWESAWPGYASGSNTEAATPTGEVKESWVSSIKDSADWATNVSDPIYVGSYVYIAAGAKLLQIDPATGKTVREGALAAPIDSIARMVYADGVVVVPLSGGRLQALTADALTTVWVTAKLPANEQGGEQQSLSTLIVKDGCVYFGTAAADLSDSYGGYLVCVDIKTGSAKWKTENADAGYYWAGAAAIGSLLVMGDDTGFVYAVDSQQGTRVGEGLDLGARVRSTVVADPDGSTVYVVTVDGVLHKVRVGADGELSEAGKVQFASASTGTPTLAGGRLYVGGQLVQGSSGGQARCGVLAVIDAKTLQVEHSITSADGTALEGSNVMSAPVVSTQGGATYVYFTANSLPGGVYRYRVGDATASRIYTPSEDKQNYCMGSITVGPDGSLYYVNDSGALFAIAGVGDDGSGDEGSKGDNAAGGGKAPAGTAMVSGKKPLARAETASEDTDEPEGDGDERDAEQASGALSATAGKNVRKGGDTDGEQEDSVRMLSVAGLVAGVIGLVLIGAWLVRARRRA